MELRDALQQLLAVENNQTTDELTKWREFCYNQLVEIKLCQINFEKNQKNHQISEEKGNEELNKLEQILLEKENEISAIKERIKEKEMKKNEIIQEFDQKKASIYDAKSKESQLNDIPRIYSEKIHVFNEKIHQIVTKTFPFEKRLANLNSRIESMVNKLSFASAEEKSVDKSLSFEQKKLSLENRALKISMKIDDIKHQEIPDDVNDLAKKYRTIDEASNALAELQAGINELQRSIKPHENGIVHCTDEIDNIINLIHKEESAQVERRSKLEEQYDITQLEEETKSSSEEIAKYEAQLQEIENNFSQLDEEMKRAVTQLSEEETQNNLEIEDLKNELASLYVPSKCKNPKEIGTRTIIDSPLI